MKGYTYMNESNNSKDINNKESIIDLLKEALSNTTHIENISIEYYRIGQREHCNMNIVTKKSK